jgi:hypothetical protein
MEIVETAPAVDDSKKALTGVAGPIREGGKAALTMESATLAAQEAQPAAEKTEKEKIEERFTEETYGEAEPVNLEETSSASEEEQSETEESEGVTSEASEEQEPEEKTHTEAEYKAAVDRMHEATTETANYKRYLEEIKPAIDHSKLMGPPSEKPQEEAPQKPSQDLFVTDYDKWYEQDLRYRKHLEAKDSPDARTAIKQEIELSEVKKDFSEKIKDLPGTAERNWVYLQGIAVEMGQKDPSFLRKSYKEQYDLAMPTFMEDMKHLKEPTKQMTKKKIPLESPSKAKEREPSGPEKPPDWTDVEKSRRDYVKFRQERNRELQGLK